MSAENEVAANNRIAIYEEPCGGVEAIGIEVYYQPALICRCGFTTIAESWAEVGEMMDEHLAEVKA
jgi:hypothetical protein